MHGWDGDGPNLAITIVIQSVVSWTSVKRVTPYMTACLAWLELGCPLPVQSSALQLRVVGCAGIGLSELVLSFVGLSQQG